MMLEEKRIKLKETKEISFDNKDISFDEILKKIEHYKNEGWEGIFVHSYYDCTTINLYKFRLENDKEYEKRMKKLERQNNTKEKMKEKRKLMYEELKKEFDGDS